MNFLHPKHCLLIVFAAFLSWSTLAQDIKSVDAKTLSDTEIKQVQKAIKDAGLSETEAINLARQRGASEQQIQNMRKRMMEAKEDNITSFTDTLQHVFDYPAIPDLKRNISKKDTITAPSLVFGANLFQSGNLTFEPGIAIQTPKNYEIGIGDRIIINIWGNSQNNYELSVNRNGQVIIPDVGPVYIAGLLFKNAEKKIIKRLSSIYADMQGDNPQTFAQLNMGQLRSMQINLVGEAVTPGTYVLPASSTVFNALYMSGGPNSIGSFRNIKVLRDKKLHALLDVYDFLVEADPSGNVRLKNDDIIFIPPFANQVEVTGEIKRNGLFEMKQGETIDDLIRFAGGFTGKSYHNSVQVQRRVQSGTKIIDVTIDQFSTTQLVNGDIVKVGEIVEKVPDLVTISGAVYRPGEYEWTKNMTLKELLGKADSIREDAFLNRGIIFRLNPDNTTSTFSFDVGKVISGEEDLVLQRDDKVVIRSHFDLEEEPFINVSGEVLNPGKFKWSQNTTLGDAIFLAGGFTEAADSTFIEVARRLTHEEASQSTNDLVHIHTFNLSRDLGLNTENSAFVLEPFDRVTVRRAPGYRNHASVLITGEVQYAGVFAISHKNMRVSDLVQMAGGITAHAYAPGATFTRGTQELGFENIALDLPKIVRQPGSSYDLLLRDGDQLYIPEFMQTVKVTGMVQNPFSITYEKGKSLKFYIDKCGGYDSKALKRKVYVKYANGSTFRNKSMKIQLGSTIVVPEKPEKKPGDVTKWLGIASAFSSLAVAIAAVLR